MVQYLSDELARRGHEVHVVCDPRVYELLRNDRTSGRSEKSTEGNINVHTTASMNARTRPIAALAFNHVRAARSSVEELVRSVRPEVIHWHNTKGFIGVPFSPPVDAVSAYTAHDYYLVCPRSNLMRPSMSFCTSPSSCSLCTLLWRKPPQLWRLMGRRVITPHKDMRIFAPSEFMSRRLETDNLEVSRVLANFVPDKGDGSEPDSRKDDEAGPMVLYVGMLEPHKGVSTLVRAFALSRGTQGLQLVIVGQGSARDAISRLVRELGVSDRVRLVGYVSNEQLLELRRRALFQIVPSEWPENAPLTILESFSASLPILGSDAGGIPEMVDSESGSLLFRAGDTADLSKSLTRIWNLRDEIDGLRRLARQTYLRRYTPQVHIDAYMNALFSRDADRHSSSNS